MTSCAPCALYRWWKAWQRTARPPGFTSMTSRATRGAYEDIEMDSTLRFPQIRITAPLALMAALGACSQPLDYDMRGRMGGPIDTSEAALAAVGDRPQADNRGVISYPNYQVAVARNGDRLADVANRVGLPAGELARYNGIEINDPLRAGEVIALPRRVSEPSPATGAPTTGRSGPWARSTSPRWPAAPSTTRPPPPRVPPRRRAPRPPAPASSRSATRSSAARPPIPWRGSTTSPRARWPTGTGSTATTRCARGSTC